MLALVYHLVKFGYYAEKEAIIRLLPSLLDLVDGTDDDPFPVPEGIIMKKNPLIQFLFPLVCLINSKCHLVIFVVRTLECKYS